MMMMMTENPPILSYLVLNLNDSNKQKI
jgi:hypothetical protein